MAERVPSDEWIDAANCLAIVTHQLSSALHEANNLLQVIAGSAEMTQLSNDLPDDVRRRAATIAEHAHRVSAILANVQELSKWAPATASGTTDVLDVLRDALVLRRHALNRGRVTVTLDAGGPALVRAGWRPVMQLVLNLLLNAEEAVRGRSGAAITIRLAAEQHVVALTIADNGPGFEPKTDRFLLKTRKDAAPRLGLGLETVDRLARTADGSLQVGSSQDGAVVTLRLPAATAL